MSISMSSTIPRVITGSLLAVMLAIALYFGDTIFFAFLLVCGVMGMWEFYSLFWGSWEMVTGRILSLVLGALVLTTAWHWQHLTFAALSASFVVLTIFFLFSWAINDHNRFSGVAVLAAGLFYVPVLLLPALNMSFVEQVFLILLAAVTDTVAYFFGMYFGKHKIWPKVSPKKTIEGSAAGLLACVVVCVIMGLVWGKAGSIEFAVLAIFLGIMAQLGDFFESALKRSRHVKDSGCVLPGHGGVLDRIDSLLFVIPSYATVKAVWVFF